MFLIKDLMFLDFSSGSHKKYETWRKDKWNDKFHAGLKTRFLE
jgi:hypothetical protein